MGGGIGGMGVMEWESPRARAVGMMFGLAAGAAPPAPKNVPEVPRAGIMLITGPSGSGKTTLLEAIAARIEPRRRVRLERMRLPERSVVDCFRLPLEQTLALLARAGLAEARLWRAMPAALSEGERFRFRLALWMSQRRRRVLLADEFCNALDRITARAVAWQLRKFMDAAATRGEGRLAIVATAHEDLAHDLMPAAQVRL